MPVYFQDNNSVLFVNSKQTASMQKIIPE